MNHLIPTYIFTSLPHSYHFLTYYVMCSDYTKDHKMQYIQEQGLLFFDFKQLEQCLCMAGFQCMLLSAQTEHTMNDSFL